MFSSPMNVRFAGGYTSDQRANIVAAKALQDSGVTALVEQKDPIGLVELLGLPQDRSPFYTKAYEKNDLYWACNNTLVRQAEEQLVKLIEDASVPFSKIEQLDKLFLDGMPRNYDVPNKVYLAIKLRLGR